MFAAINGVNSMNSFSAKSTPSVKFPVDDDVDSIEARFFKSVVGKDINKSTMVDAKKSLAEIDEQLNAAKKEVAEKDKIESKSKVKFTFGPTVPQILADMNRRDADGNPAPMIGIGMGGGIGSKWSKNDKN